MISASPLLHSGAMQALRPIPAPLPVLVRLKETVEIFRLECERKPGHRELRAASANGLRPKPAKLDSKPRFKSCKWG